MLRFIKVDWLGRLERMAPGKRSKKILDGEMGGMRTVGRPKGQWL